MAAQPKISSTTQLGHDSGARRVDETGQPRQLQPAHLGEAGPAPGQQQDDERDGQGRGGADDHVGERQRQVVPGGDPVQRNQHQLVGQRAFRMTMTFSSWCDSTSKLPAVGG